MAEPKVIVSRTRRVEGGLQKAVAKSDDRAARRRYDKDIATLTASERAAEKKASSLRVR